MRLIDILYIVSFSSIFLIACYPSQNLSKKEEILEMTQPKVDHSVITSPYLGEVYTVEEVTEMARFPGCDSNGLSSEELRKCSTEEMLKYMYSNLNYPALAREHGVQGTVTLEFIITPEGRIRSAKINKEPGAGTGNAAMDMLAKMEQKRTWIPAVLDNTAVAVTYILPVKFKLA